MSDDLLLRPATELAALLRSRELSARELLEASLTRRDEVDPVLNALVVRDDERARQRAADLDDQLARTGRPAGVLHGLPTAHKDLLDAEGLVTSFGSALFADNVARTDSVLAARVRAAGAVRVGKTNTAELGAGSQRWRRRRTRDRHGRGGRRQRPGRLAAQPGQLRRRRRAAALARPGAERAVARRLVRPVGARPHGAPRGRRAPAARGRVGTRPARPVRHLAAARRAPRARA